MSLHSLRETGQHLHQIHQSARESWRSGGDGSEITGEQDGITIRIVYEGSNRNTDYRSVFLDGFLFAREIETIPWNIFREISVSYTAYLDLTLDSAHALLAKIDPVGRVGIDEEWYPSEEGPMRYYAHCSEFDDVIALWKAWKPKYLK